MFLIVSNQVLRACHNTDALDANDRLKCSFTVEIGIGAETIAEYAKGREVITEGVVRRL